MSNLYEYETPCGEKKRGLADYSNELLDSENNIFDINEHIIRKESKIIYKNILFDDMKIPFYLTLEKELDNGISDIEIINCVFEKDVFINKEFTHLSLKNCCFEGKFYINNQYNNPDKVLKIDSLNIQDTKFNANFKLHNSEVKHFVLKDTDFEKNADFFKTKFLTTEDIVFHTINFRALALFGETVFSEYLIFKYVTFQGYSHFREAVFKKGLNLEYANIEKEMNLFGIKELDKKKSIENTNQETYRIVKYQLQKVGNIIDSNKYHALELEKKRKKVCVKSCKDRKFLADCIVLNIHKLSSNYSTNWIKALGWIILVGIISNYILKNAIDIEFYKYSSLITSQNEFCDIYWLFILNKIVLGYLYYQFVTAIRKDTRK